MSFAYMPLYTGDYLRKTQHLSMSEHGCYLKFLMYCWDLKSPLPLDERKLQGICNVRSDDDMGAMRRVLHEFFSKAVDGYRQKRMTEEVAKAEMTSDIRSKAGKKSAANKSRSKARSQPRAKAEHKPDMSAASAEPQLVAPALALDSTPASKPALPPPLSNPGGSIPSSNSGSEEHADCAAEEGGEKVLKVNGHRSPADIAAQLQAQGVNANANSIAVKNWLAGNVSNEVLAEAIAIAKQHKPDEKIPANYLVPIVAELLQEPREPKAQGPPWWSSHSGIDAKGRELGLIARGTESYDDYKARIFTKLREGVH